MVILKTRLYLINLILIVFFTCCNLSYSSIEKQCNYLQKIADIHEEAIEEERIALQQFGYRSKAHSLALRKREKAVKESRIKMEAFFKLHGFPTVEEHGDEFVKIPTKIMVDYGRDYHTCKRNFKYFYMGWQNGDLKDWVMVWYLQIMYQHQYGDILRLENPYTEKMQLEILMGTLNIDQYLASSK